MKALSLWEPWATLVAAGVKRVETRGWQTPYRGRILIHASKRWTWELYAYCERIPFLLAEAGVVLPPRAGRALPPSPFGNGHAVGSAELVDCVPAGLCFRHQNGATSARWVDAAGPPYLTLSDADVRLGDFGPGRYGWFLAAPERFARPFPLAGQRLLFDVPNRMTCGAAPAWPDPVAVSPR